MSEIGKLGKDGFVASGAVAVKIVQAVTIASALQTYARCGMLMNRAYTPKNLLATAASITGKKFKRGEYLQAATALREWAHVKHTLLS